MLYRVHNWSKLYENNRTRELKKLQWVLIPNKQDGEGYTALMDHENGPAHFGAWIVILQIASKCEPRGTLVRACGKPHTPETIGRMSHLPAGLCRDALKRLVGDEIGWMEVVDESKSCKDLGTIPHPPAENRDAYKNRTEQKGREQKRNSSSSSGFSHAGKLADAVLPKIEKSTAVSPQDLDRLSAEMGELGNGVDPWPAVMKVGAHLARHGVAVEDFLGDVKVRFRKMRTMPDNPLGWLIAHAEKFPERTSK